MKKETTPTLKGLKNKDLQLRVVRSPKLALPILCLKVGVTLFSLIKHEFFVANRMKAIS
jgi:hypothetical protein